MIHPLAHIDAGKVTIYEGACIWQFASIIRGAEIGEGCSVGAGAIVDGAEVWAGTTIGAGAQLHPGTLVEARVFIGPGVICCNDRWPRTDKDGFETEALLSGAVVTVHIKHGASIGAGAIILPGVMIGVGAMVAAGAVVERSVPAGHLYKRSGEIVPVDTLRAERRICEAAA